MVKTLPWRCPLRVRLAHQSINRSRIYCGLFERSGGLARDRYARSLYDESSEQGQRQRLERHPCNDLHLVYWRPLFSFPGGPLPRMSGFFSLVYNCPLTKLHLIEKASKFS
jgi:hypothetical protein